MRPVSDLYGRHAGEDIYVVGTGTSTRVFPPGFLEGKITVGLNMAWKSASVCYGITIHPDLNIPEFMGETTRPEIEWIVPEEKSRALLTPAQFAQAEARYFRFEYTGKPNSQPLDQPSDSGRILDWVRRPSGNMLYVWSSIAQTGANLAANMGARNVILVGCDNTSLLDNHHDQYYEGMAEVRGALRERGVNLVSLQPFLGISNFERDFERLCRELGKPSLIPGHDISKKASARIRLGAFFGRVKSRLAGAG